NTSDIGAQWLGILDYATVNSTNWTLSDWNASVSEAVAQYPQIREWEIWNEPEYFGSSYQDWNSTHYFYMIRSASMIIKSRYPNDTVVCFGGATTHPLFGSNSVAYEYPFYEQAWKLGASKYCDAISLHAYDDYQQYNLSKLGYNGNGLTMGGEWNYTIGLYENLTHKPIWITETGLESPNSYTDSNEQTLYMNQTLRVLSASPFVKRVYWFQLASYPNFPWGLIQLPYFGFQQMEIKPAWNIYVNFSKNEGRKPSLTTAPTTSMPEGKTVNSTIASTTAPAAVNQGPEPQNANNKGEVLAALVIIVILAAYFYSKRRKTAQQT
ncbi:MAG: hypothetical protein KGH62_03220, partial [Candidatus Micrarchaeota archaeon]|nr:hypothetical protein [Candidatus Micrarchaeota archaeon]